MQASKPESSEALFDNRLCSACESCQSSIVKSSACNSRVLSRNSANSSAKAAEFFSIVKRLMCSACQVLYWLATVFASSDDCPNSSKIWRCVAAFSKEWCAFWL